MSTKIRSDYAETLDMFVPPEAKSAFEEVRQQNRALIAQQVDAFSQEVSNQITQNMEATRTSIEATLHDSQQVITSLLANINSGLSAEQLTAASTALQAQTTAYQSHFTNLGKNFRKGALQAIKASGLPLPVDYINEVLDA